MSFSLEKSICWTNFYCLDDSDVNKTQFMMHSECHTSELALQYIDATHQIQFHMSQPIQGRY